MKKICIDPGHGGKDPGAVGKLVDAAGQHAFEEADFNLIMAGIVSAQLVALGYTVEQTRAFDNFLTLQERCDKANKNFCDIYVSIHANAAEVSTAEGMEVHYYAAGRSERLAESVYSELVKTFPDHKKRGVKQSAFYVLKHTHMPAVLIEGGFITNAKEAQFLADKDQQVKMASAIVRGIVGYLKQ